MKEQNKQILSFDELSAKLMEELSRKCYGSETMDNYRRALSRIGRFMDEEGLCDYSGEVGEAFIAARISGAYISESHLKFTQTVVRRLNDVSKGIGYRLIKSKTVLLTPPQYSKPLESYLQHCQSHGNKECTITWKRSICCKFLCSLTSLGCLSVDDISTDYICRTIVCHTNKDAYAVVRAFLQHLFQTNILKIDYSDIIPKYSRRKTLPTAYSIDEVQQLEAIANRTTKVGKRDYAALLLATRLGLRSGDIVRLTYENIDYVTNTISLVQEKTNQPLTLPLLSEIREAINDYVRCARPNSDSKYIFLGANAPFDRMSTSAMRHALTKYFSDAGIDISGKKHGPHSLRSSLASSMINDGTPYEVVRRLLGHSDPDAVKHYAKVDIEKLRCYSIDVPLPSGKFKDILAGRA